MGLLRCHVALPPLQIHTPPLLTCQQNPLNGKREQRNFLGFTQISKGWPFFLSKRLSSPKEVEWEKERVRMVPSVHTESSRGGCAVTRNAGDLA